MNALLGLAVDPKAQGDFHALGFAVLLATTSIALLMGLLYMTVAVAPNLTLRCSSALRERNMLSFFAGLPVAGVSLGLLAAGQAVPVLSIPGALIGGLGMILGWSAASEDIGRRLYWACGKEGTRASHLAAGWLVFSASACVPVIGWFVVLPYVSLSGLGSFVVSAFSHGRPAAPAPKEIEYVK